MPDALDQLHARLHRVEDLKNAAEVLSWDQETYMPEGGAAARAQQLSTLQTLAHEQFTSDDVGALLDQLEDADLNALSADLVRVVRHDYERARRVPPALVTELSQAVSRAKQAWKAARAEDNFSTFAPHLEQLVDLNVQKARAIGYDATPYDALLDAYEPGMKTETVAQTFATLRDDLVPLVDAIADAPHPDDDFLHRTFDPTQQQTFGEDVIRDVGFDFSRGRQDHSAHPFTTSFGTGDVRLTTRFESDFFPSGFFATLHEAGHGLYEQGFAEELARTPLADGASLGIHESQSRLWENQVGRSHAFWAHYFPALQGVFPDALGDVETNAFYRAVNKVEPSLIRVEADEVTYNLHIMLRFELERGLIEGTITVDELPALWNERMDDYLGIRPDTDADGVLQDIHWSLGAFGYFPTYALGTLMSAQFFAQATADLGDVEAHVAEGDFAPLLGWLRENVHQHGRRYRATELLERVTNEQLTATPWLDYIREKYGALYGFSAAPAS